WALELQSNVKTYKPPKSKVFAINSKFATSKTVKRSLETSLSSELTIKKQKVELPGDQQDQNVDQSWDQDIEPLDFSNPTDDTQGLPNDLAPLATTSNQLIPSNNTLQTTHKYL